MKNLIALLLLIAPSGLLAQQVTTTTTKVIDVFTYANIGSKGDFIFQVADPIEQCTGFWGDSDSPGHQNMLSVLLSVYHAQTPIVVYAEQSELFPRSSNKYCKLNIIRLREK